MTKEEAIQKWVDRDVKGMPQEWFSKLRYSFMEDEDQPLPMWGTMFLVNESDGEKMLNNSRLMVVDKGNIYLDSLDEAERELVEKAIEEDDYSVLEDYISDEMAGAYCILDKDGSPTSAYIYTLDDEYFVGIHGAGWDFYDGVWDKLYDVCGLEWHEEREVTIKQEILQDLLEALKVADEQWFSGGHFSAEDYNKLDKSVKHFMDIRVLQKGKLTKEGLL